MLTLLLALFTGLLALWLERCRPSVASDPNTVGFFTVLAGIAATIGEAIGSAASAVGSAAGSAAGALGSAAEAGASGLGSLASGGVGAGAATGGALTPVTGLSSAAGGGIGAAGAAGSAAPVATSGLSAAGLSAAGVPSSSSGGFLSGLGDFIHSKYGQALGKSLTSGGDEKSSHTNAPPQMAMPQLQRAPYSAPNLGTAPNSLAGLMQAIQQRRQQQQMLLGGF